MYPIKKNIHSNISTAKNALNLIVQLKRLFILPVYERILML
jgi:hypothetical protein